MKKTFTNKAPWFFVALMSLYIYSPAQTQAAPNFYGKTVNTVGQVEVDGQNAFKGMTIKPTATIKTHENSFIEIVFNF